MPDSGDTIHCAYHDRVHSLAEATSVCRGRVERHADGGKIEGTAKKDQSKQTPARVTRRG